MMNVETLLRIRNFVAGGLCALAIGAAGCADGVGAPTSPSLGPTSSLSVANDSPRSGEVNITKECGDYHGLSGEHCTITASDLKGIDVDSTITYINALEFPLLNTPIVLAPPGPGNNTANGHCRLDVPSGIGHCRLSGGTGQFSKLVVEVDVSRDALDGNVYYWIGTYRFEPGN